MRLVGFIRAELMLAALLVTASFSVADNVTIVSDRDNTLYEDPSGSRSNGAGDHFFAGRTSEGTNSKRRGLIRFDVAGSVPAGSVINSVTLALHMSRSISGNETVSIYRLLGDWGEGNSHAPGQEGAGGPADTGDATWLHTFFPSAFWMIPGGDYHTQASASATVGSVGTYSWGSTSRMVADGQRWLYSPDTNYGWLVLGRESASTTVKRFDTRENANASSRPQLLIDYTPYDPAVSCRFGTVNLAASGSSHDVLKVNGSPGDALRQVFVPVNSPIQVDVNPSPSGPEPGNFAMYVWPGVPTGGTVAPLPASLGNICLPILLTGGTPLPKKTWNNLGKFPKLGFPDFDSEPAPTRLLDAPDGWHVPVTVTMQGLILDNGSVADVPASVTNAVIIMVQ